MYGAGGRRSRCPPAFNSKRCVIGALSRFGCLKRRCGKLGGGHSSRILGNSLLVIEALLAMGASMAVAAGPAGEADRAKLPTISDFANCMAAEDYAGAQRIAGVLLQTGGTAETGGR